MKYNLGCGFDYRHHWVNVDKSQIVGADLVHDLLVFPWPIADESADEILLSQVLEELFLSWPTCLEVFSELYRIAKPGCRVAIAIREQSASETPIRSAISASFFNSLDLARCEASIGSNASATPYALNLRVDFAVQQTNQLLNDAWRAKLNAGEISPEQVQEAAQSFNNVISKNEVVMRAVKPFAPGRWLRNHKGVVIRRVGGLGDVLMALSAIRAIKSVADVPIYLETAAAYVDFARLCPHVNGVFDIRHQIASRLVAANPDTIMAVDWSAVRFGIAQRHEVDAFLQAVGLFPADDAKGLEIDLPPSEHLSAITARLESLPPNRKRILLHPGVTDPNRTWPLQFWQEVARYAIEKDFAVITIGHNGGPEGKGVASLDGPGILHFANTLDLAGTVHLMRQCDMLISGDAGPVQLAGASDIHIVGLYSTVGGAARMPFRHGSRSYKATAIAPACDLHPCYSRITDPRFVDPFCEQEGIAPDDIATLFSRWCIKPDRYACVTDPGMLERAKGEIDRLNASETTISEFCDEEEEQQQEVAKDRSREIFRRTALETSLMTPV